MIYTRVALNDSVDVGIVYCHDTWLGPTSNGAKYCVRSTTQSYLDDLVFDVRSNLNSNSWCFLDLGGTSSDVKVYDLPFMEFVGATFKVGYNQFCINGPGDYTVDRSLGWNISIFFKLKDEFSLYQGVESINDKLESSVISVEDPYNDFWHRSEFAIGVIGLVLLAVDFALMIRQLCKRGRL